MAFADLILTFYDFHA